MHLITCETEQYLYYMFRMTIIASDRVKLIIMIKNYKTINNTKNANI